MTILIIVACFRYSNYIYSHLIPPHWCYGIGYFIVTSQLGKLRHRSRAMVRTCAQSHTWNTRGFHRSKRNWYYLTSFDLQNSNFVWFNWIENRNIADTEDGTLKRASLRRRHWVCNNEEVKKVWGRVIQAEATAGAQILGVKSVTQS